MLGVRRKREIRLVDQSRDFAAKAVDPLVQRRAHFEGPCAIICFGHWRARPHLAQACSRSARMIATGF